MTGNTGDIIYSMRVMMFVALLCMGYSLSRPLSAGKMKDDLMLYSKVSPQEKEWAGLPSWQRHASEKAIERYTAAQDSKWRKWNEAMFERSH
jgi:hypothetical protein